MSFFSPFPSPWAAFFKQFYSLTDRIIIGRALGKEALAAVGASFPILFPLIALIMGVIMGATFLSLRVIRLPLSWFLWRRFGTDGIWRGIPIAWIAETVLSLAYYGTGRWKRKTVVPPAVLTAVEAVRVYAEESKAIVFNY